MKFTNIFNFKFLFCEQVDVNPDNSTKHMNKEFFKYFNIQSEYIKCTVWQRKYLQFNFKLNICHDTNNIKKLWALAGAQLIFTHSSFYLQYIYKNTFANIIAKVTTKTLKHKLPATVWLAYSCCNTCAIPVIKIQQWYYSMAVHCQWSRNNKIIFSHVVQIDQSQLHVNTSNMPVYKYWVW